MDDWLWEKVNKINVILVEYASVIVTRQANFTLARSAF